MSLAVAHEVTSANVGAVTTRAPSGESRIFVSYAREDLEFVDRLEQVLLPLSIECWIDRSQIPPSAEWKEEVRAAITAADAVIFVISPSSMTSAECLKELAVAADLKKLLIPVLLAEPGVPVPEPLASRQWTHVGDPSDVTNVAVDIRRALQIDLRWLRVHARLLVRAQDWDAKQRDGGVFLRGKDLREAEDYLATIGQRSPQPTSLQTEFVVRSRRARARLQGLIISFLAAAVIALSVLSLIAYQRTRLAQRRLALANARNLAGTARDLAVAEPAQALLLAAEAVAVARPLDDLERVDAEDAMWSTLARQRQVWKFLPAPSLADVVALTLDRDSGLLLGGFGGGIGRWDLKKGRPVLPGVKAREGEILDSYWDFAAAPGGRGAVVTAGSNVIVFDLQTGQERDRFDLKEMAAVQPFSLRSIDYDSTGAYLAVGACESGPDPDNPLKCGRSMVVIIDTKAKKMARSMVSTTPGTVHDIAFRPHSDQVATATDDGEAPLWDWRAGTMSKHGLKCPGKANTLAFNAEGTEMVVGCENGQLLRWQMDNTITQRTPPIPDEPIVSVAFSHGDRRVAYGSKKGVVRVVDFSRGDIVAIFKEETAVKALTFDPRDDLLVSGAESGRVTAWRMGMLTPVTVELGHSISPIQSAAAALGGNRVAQLRGNGELVVWDLPANGHPVSREIAHGLPAYKADGFLTFSADGDQLALGSCSQPTMKGALCDVGEVRLFSLGGGDRQVSFAAHHSFVSHIVYPASDEIITSSLHELLVWNPSLGPDRGKSFPLDGEDVTAFLESPDRKLLVVGTHRGGLIVADRTDWSRRHRQVVGDRVMAMAVSPDSGLLVVSTSSETIGFAREGGDYRKQGVIWQNGATDLAFDPDGRTLSLEIDGTRVLRMRLADRRIVARRDLPPASGRSAFVPGAPKLLTWANHLSLWDLTWTPRLAGASCEVAGRPLSPAEVAQFMVGEGPSGCPKQHP
jgi:WD40 repeat protein